MRERSKPQWHYYVQNDFPTAVETNDCVAVGLSFKNSKIAFSVKVQLLPFKLFLT